MSVSFRNNNSTLVGNGCGCQSTSRDEDHESAASVIATATSVAGQVVGQLGRRLEKSAEVATAALEGRDHSVRQSLDHVGRKMGGARRRALKKLTRAQVRLATAAKTAEQADRLKSLSKHAGHALSIASATATAAEQYRQSPATSPAGKATDALAAGATSVLLGSLPTWAPAVVVADVVTGGGVSQHFSGASSAVVTLAEGAVTGDIRGMERFQDEALAGKHGPVLKHVVDAGQYWADNGFSGTLRDFAREVGSLFEANQEQLWHNAEDLSK